MPYLLVLKIGLEGEFMVNLVTIAVAYVSVWYDYEATPPPVFCHATADFGIKLRRASLCRMQTY